MAASIIGAFARIIRAPAPTVCARALFIRASARILAAGAPTTGARARIIRAAAPATRAVAQAIGAFPQTILLADKTTLGRQKMGFAKLTTLGDTKKPARGPAF